MEPPRPAPRAYLDSRPAVALDPKGARPARSRAPGAGVLWAVTHRHTGHAPPLCGWAASQCRDDPVAGVADGPGGSGRENGTVDGVGQGLVARQSRRSGVAQGAPPSCQAGRWRSSWCAPCRARAPGCTASRRNGCMANGRLPHRIGSWGLTNCSIGSVPIMTVSYSSPLHNKSRGLALGLDCFAKPR